MIIEINRNALPLVDGINIVSATVQPQAEGGQVDLMVTGSPAQIRRLREALLAQSRIFQPVMGREPRLAFIFAAWPDATLLTQATELMISVLSAIARPSQRKSIEESTTSPTPTATPPSQGQRREPRAPRRRLTVRY